MKERELTCPCCGEKFKAEPKPKHRLLCGDSTVITDVERLMQGEKADMVFTDPPYGMNLNTDWSSAKSNLKFYKEKGCQGQGNKYDKVIGDSVEYDPSFIISYFDKANDIFLWGGDYYAKRLDGGSWFVWDKRSNEGTDTEKVSQSDKMFGSCFELCWSKNRHKREIARVKWAGIFGTEKEPDKDKSRKHPTQKPVELCIWFIDKFSKTNNIIADLFLGSGSTLIACEKLSRRCYGMEIDEHYCDVIIKRWEDFTGKKAELITGK
jgi:site-specific DNA-methyltransferase (adenine-specific)